MFSEHRYEVTLNLIMGVFKVYLKFKFWDQRMQIRQSYVLTYASC